MKVRAMQKLRWLISDGLNDFDESVKVSEIWEKLDYLIELEKQQTDEFAIAFHNWMRKNDTAENADKFFHYTDEDMLNVFKEETGW